MSDDDVLCGLSDGDEADGKSDLGSDFFDNQGSVLSGAKPTDSGDEDNLPGKERMPLGTLGRHSRPAGGLLKPGKNRRTR
jgi:hypothetical protein